MACSRFCWRYFSNWALAPSFDSSFNRSAAAVINTHAGMNVAIWELINCSTHTDIQGNFRAEREREREGEREGGKEVAHICSESWWSSRWRGSWGSHMSLSVLRPTLRTDNWSLHGGSSPVYVRTFYQWVRQQWYHVHYCIREERWYIDRVGCAYNDVMITMEH